MRPPYARGGGWFGVRLDGNVDWDEITQIYEDANRTGAASSADRRALADRLGR